MTIYQKIQSYLETVLYIIPIRAKPKPRMTKADTWKKRPVITEYWAYKDQLKDLVAETSWKPTDTIRLVFVFEPAASFPKKKKEALYFTPHQQKPDTDNLVKAFKDCLYDKDETVWCDEAIKIYGPINQILICSQ
jgi:Holliday junction resolvase RusA-like endonuclease